MRKIHKKRATEFIKLLEQAHLEIKKAIDEQNPDIAMDLLGQCQEGAVGLGNLIEKEEGEGFATISLLEDYCETAYQIYEGLLGDENITGKKAYKTLRKSLIQIENSIKSDIKVRLEIVFLPYKASMWDSLESIWKAVCEDSDCEAYVVPIPYYDRNRDGSLGTYHYEGNDLPDYVPIIRYDAYPLENRRPDIIYIHNPYDNENFVTSIDPRFYSFELKKYTDCLVYVPYYSTSGGMSEAQSLCQAYYHVDYIVVQSERFVKFFDPVILREKFLCFGSPKFDRAIQLCQNPPEPPGEWKERIEGKTVYFYNTSINGMLGDTDSFLKKMEYVFQCFEGREDVCLLWRPHPLLESAFNSMRPEYKAQYETIKKSFIEKNLGIYDDTSDMTVSIALSDVYIGDSATSVTSLFGIVGKPLFIFNNLIHSLPQKDDWRGEKIFPRFDKWGNDRYQVTRNNQLWFSEKNDYHYKFYMDLGIGFSGGGYYIGAVEIKGKLYVLPGNAQNILVIKNKQIKRIDFRIQITQAGAFFSYWYNENYIFLFPNQYPLVLRFNIETEELKGVEGIQQFHVRWMDGERKAGGIGLYGNELVFASPADKDFLFMDINTLQARGLSCRSSQYDIGTQGIVTDGDDLWLLPLNGMTLTRWNPKTGEVQEYDELPQDFQSINWPHNVQCEERPFGNMAFSREGEKETIVISPRWGNMYVSLDRETGKMEKWELPISLSNRGKNGYFAADGMGGFCITYPQMGKPDCRIWDAPNRKLYDINIDTKEYREVELDFDYEDVKIHEPGFSEESDWLQYCLNEDAFNSLENLLDGKITGTPFDRQRQIKAFSRINASTDGKCGEKIHGFLCENI